MKKTAFGLALLISAIMLFPIFSVSAEGEQLTAKNFKEIYPAATNAAEITDTANGAQITFHKVDSRVTLVGTGEDDEWGRVMKFNGLVMEFSSINVPKATTKTNGVTLAFTFSQEAGSFYSTGSTGVHIRLFYTVDGMSIYMKSASAPDTDAYYPQTGIPWTQFPSRLTVKIYKSGSEYIFLFNELECRVPADKIEADVSRSGDVFVNIGVMGVTDRTSSLVANRIWNDPSLTAQTQATTTAAPKPTTTASQSAGTTKPKSPTTKAPTTTEANPQPTESQETDSQPSETAAPVLSGPNHMSADSAKAVIDGSTMTIRAKQGLTVSSFAEAFTIDEGYEIGVFDADGNRLEDTAAIEDGKIVRVLGGDQVFAEFTLVLMKDAVGNAEGGFPTGLVVGIVIAVIVIAGGAVAAVLLLKKKKDPNGGGDDDSDQPTES